MAKQTYLTAEGLKKLQDELEYYKVTRRKEVAEALKVAKAAQAAWRDVQLGKTHFSLEIAKT